MHYSTCMDVIHSIYYLLDHSGDIFLVTFQPLEQLATLNILHQQEDMILITKMSIKFDNIWMIKHVKYLQFQAKLRLHLVLSDSRLKNLLKRKDHASRFMSTDINFTKFTRTN